MQDSARWKWLGLLIIIVIGGAVALLYPPGRKLKLGIDLAGGAALVYEVEVRRGENAKQAIESTIETLKKRVDPAGIMNLVWRRMAGNRFEVQMPAPPRDVKRLRDAYQQADRDLLQTNLSRGAVQRVLDLPPGEREAALGALAAGNPNVETLLTDLVTAYDNMRSVDVAYEAAEREKDQAEQQLDDLPADTVPDRRRKAMKNLDDKTAILIAVARQKLTAKKELAAAWQHLLANNIDPLKLRGVINASTKPGRVPRGGKGPGLSQRQLALNRLIESHPGLETQINDWAQTYAEYEKIKGPLDDPNDLKRLLRGSGVLEFRVAPRAGLPAESKYREQLKENGPTATGEQYRWFEIDDITSFVDDPKDRESLLKDPAAYFTSRYASSGRGVLGMIGDRFGDNIYLLLSDDTDSSLTQAQESWKLSSARVGQDDLGLPAIYFTLNAVGGQYMARLTGNHKGEQMAIVLDDKVISAPTIQSTIGAEGIITKTGSGGYDPRELRYMIQTLNAGSLQARVSDEPIYERTFSAAFGADNLKKGLTASYWALIVVAGFIAIYYLFNGLIADFALFGNMVLILGIMSLFQATFTLPGIAGIVLTIGMAVDANVLIFERVREELERGAHVRPAVRTGYGKALSTIIDANLTTLIICLVLGYTATAEVKGFAVVLGIGILATLFTALLCTRVWIEIYMLATKARSLPMLPIAIPAIGRLLHPNINWVGKRFAFFGLSVLVVVASIALLTQRGQDIFDIEFRSGTQIGFTFADGKTMDIADVRSRLNKMAGDSGIAELAGDRAKVVIAGDVEGTVGDAFTIQTLAENTNNRVSNAIIEAFDDVLDIKRAIAFDGYQTEAVNDAPTFAIASSRLGDNIDRADMPEDVGDFIGGVAILINNMKPATTLADIRQRIGRVRDQPPHNKYGYRKVEVFGLNLAVGDQAAPGGDKSLLYDSVVVVAHDGTTSYTESPDTFDVRTGLAQTEWSLVRDALTRETSLGSVAGFSPQVSQTMRVNALGAIALSLVAVVAYIWLRFGSLRYGFAAIVALAHDVAIALGIVALAGMVADTPVGRSLLLSDFKIDLAMVAAMLTIIGYSLNDTIVVFDRIRENRGRLTFATPVVINVSINQTISRTVLTSLTTIMALLTLYLFGGDGVHGFAFAMLIGVGVGTYSSIAIAAPIVLLGTPKEQAAASAA